MLLQPEKKYYAAKAYGKINLALDILGTREDGYHELDMVMQQVTLADDIELTLMTEEEAAKLPKDAFFQMESQPNIYYTVNRADLNDPERDLACRGVKLLMKEFNISTPVVIRVNKRIPVAAGMAGGSTDAATAMLLANEAFSLGLSLEELMERGVTLGADIPYCMLGKTARAQGIGEVLTPLADVENMWILLVKPEISVSTGWVYQNYDNYAETHSISHPKVEQMLSVLSEKKWEEIPSYLGNVLEYVTIPAHPVIAEIKEEMRHQGAENALMSGSGPTVFGIFGSEAAAKKAAEVFSEKGYQEVYVVQTVTS